MHKRDRDTGNAATINAHSVELTLKNYPHQKQLFKNVVALLSTDETRCNSPSRHCIMINRRNDKSEDKKIKTHEMMDAIATHNKKKVYWWKVPVKTPIKCKHSRPVIMTLDREEKLYSCSADDSIKQKISEKGNTHA